MIYEKFGENIYVMKDELFYDVVVGAIELPTKLIMIDTGTNLRKMKEFKEKVEEATKKKFETVFITHYHGDHIIGNQLFSDCDIIGSKWTLERLNLSIPKWTDEVIEQTKKRIPDPLALVGLKLTPLNKSFEGQMEIVDGDVQVIVKQTGGHTKGSSYIYCPNYKVLFGGDNLFIDSYHWGGEETCDPNNWIATLKEYLSLDVDYYVPGHGPVSDKEPLKYILAFFELVKSTMLKMASEGKSEEEILKKCYNLDFYPIDEEEKGDVEMKEKTLKKWYDVWVNNKK
ncbi:MAG: MBL fold metallo-hydrolase [Candidatus Heimdallarchaeota archaeon]|nr:MBL fold metallo-hydrolase [Candidatus Heimdallarchaeota archaeon]MBY8994403.1 MBL fold metallo-hydrolase [Candidatus Heimdallarchaeota archaeon]